MKKSILTKKEDVENSLLPPTCTTSGHNSVSTHFAFGAGKCGTHKNGLLSPDSGNHYGAKKIVNLLPFITLHCMDLNLNDQQSRPSFWQYFYIQKNKLKLKYKYKREKNPVSCFGNDTIYLLLSTRKSFGPEKFQISCMG